MAKCYRVYTLRFTRYGLEISNFSVSTSELAVCKVDGMQHILWFDYWYQLAGDCTRQLCVNVIGNTLLAQRLHMLHIGK